jgi:hypothetical protein
MKAGSVLAILVLAAPAAAAAQGHGAGFGGGFGLAVGGMGHSGVSSGFGHGGSHGPGRGDFRHDGFHEHGFDHHHFRDHAVAGWGWWGWPYWGWSDCGYDANGCGYQHASDDYGMTDPPAPPPCGAWSERAGRYVWSTGPCAAADDPPPARYAQSSANECSDWVWRADLHRSICKRPSRATG